MRKVPKEKILERIRRDNPWWESPGQVQQIYRDWRPRPYIKKLMPLVSQTEIRRAVVLMGPRRVGKTVLIHHAIDELFGKGVSPSQVCYVSVDHPLFNGLGLEDFLELFRTAGNVDFETRRSYVFFDEIQYLRNWETHLKTLVDSFPEINITVSGSAAAALRLRSSESGAGRFTDFILPPLTFYEYLVLLDLEHLFNLSKEASRLFQANETNQLNDHFIRYLNFGGYPEVVFSEQIQKDPGRYIKSDIIDKVLLRDLPSLYGIQDIQELNSLFTTLAFNTANEVSLVELSKGSGVAKNTIKKYIEYLEAAFLIRVVHRVDKSAKKFKRANFFKVYLTNPSIRAALFSPVGGDDPTIGSLVETAIFSQWFHSDKPMFYARWNRGEVDIVHLSNEQKPQWAVEVKWSDRIVNHPEDLGGLVGFCKRNNLNDVLVTTKTIRTNGIVDGVPIEYAPASEYCLALGRNIVGSRAFGVGLGDDSDFEIPD